MKCADMMASASERPRDVAHFRSVCSDTGKSAKCCVLPIVSKTMEPFEGEHSDSSK